MRLKVLALITLVLAIAALASLEMCPKPAEALACDGTRNDTAAVQALLDAAAQPNAAPALLQPGSTYCIDGNKGLNVASNVRLEMRGATLAMNPGCAKANSVCRVLNFVPGATKAEVLGPGTIEGDDSAGCSNCFSILVRIDGAEAMMRRVTLRRSRSDLIWIGGNTKASAVLDELVGDRAGRNLISIVNAREVIISRGTFSNAFGPDPGACLDVEPNPGESADRIVVLWSTFKTCRLGVINQKAKGSQGQGFIVAWSTIEDIRSTAPGVPTGLAVNGVIGSVLFQNRVDMPAWPGTGSVPLAGTIAGDSAELAATHAYLLENVITGQVNDRGTTSEGDDVVSGDFRFSNVRGLVSAGNTITNGRFTQALEGVMGDDVRVANEQQGAYTRALDVR